MTEATAIVVQIAFIGGLVLIACELYAIWLICIASERQFNRRLAKLRARHVDWREWRKR
ncbi:hypothetical protein EDF22_0628 [Rathayibacter sp. PhB127]|uniref:hypothetical protein n=1 Tax=Rathayibacter sp. PhB127 TaxID=2485176 RepID=UPI000FA4097D|nr:hypothetical protein [Rathayibacter sp. PhB127]ROS28897.1 hypothetical protein EDF22_0628 [Rathayibacter sp. PhB127]